MEQILSLSGAALVLVAFGGLQLGRLTTAQPGYQVANLVGATLLVGAGLITQTWGFVVLNVVWSGFAAVRLAQMLTARRSRSTASGPPST